MFTLRTILKMQGTLHLIWSKIITSFAVNVKRYLSFILDIIAFFSSKLILTRWKSYGHTWWKMEKIFICGFILSSIFVEFKLVILCFSVIGGLKLIMKTALSWSLSSPTIGYNLSIWLKHHMNSILIVKNFTLIDPVQNKNDFTLQEDTYCHLDLLFYRAQSPKPTKLNYIKLY